MFAIDPVFGLVRGLVGGRCGFHRVRLCHCLDIMDVGLTMCVVLFMVKSAG